MGSKKSPAPVAPKPQIAIKAEQDKIAADAKASAEAKAKAERDKAIMGNESQADIQAREAQTLRSPKKAKIRGRRSLIADPIGGGAGKESLG